MTTKEPGRRGFREQWPCRGCNECEGEGVSWSLSCRRIRRRLAVKDVVLLGQGVADRGSQSLREACVLLAE